MKQLLRGNTIPRPHIQQGAHVKTAVFAILEIKIKLEI